VETNESAAGSVAVVIPTRDRPDRLRICLDALERARRRCSFSVYVGDSSTSTDLRAEVAAVCKRHDFVHLDHHEGVGVGAARNFCTRIAQAELLVNVDDDIYVEEDTIERLVDCYMQGRGWRAVAGSVVWGNDWSRPIVMRRIGYGRPARHAEAPSFLIGALFLYPRALALACPWIETVPTSDDRMMGALWRAKGVQMLFAPGARAAHDDRHYSYGVRVSASATPPPPRHSRDHIYVNLFDALIANRSLLRACEYEVLGFLAGAKTYLRQPGSAWTYLVGWLRGHKQFVRDWSVLRSAARAPLPPARAS
jgi:glycosyltransferase involved in cell wall biosynthesis